MNKRTICVGIIAYKENSVLLVEHTELARLPTGTYGFPAGRVDDADKSRKEAAVREFNEETNYSLPNMHVLERLNCLEEEYVGSNLVNYKHVYYVASSYTFPPHNLLHSPSPFLHLSFLKLIFFLNLV